MISFQNDILPLKNQLYRLALRITLDSAEAEDIVQETLIKVWNRRESWTSIDNIEAFCFTICRNKALDYVRSVNSRNESLDSSQNERPDTSYTPSQQTVVNDQMAWCAISWTRCQRSRNRAYSFAILKERRIRRLRDCLT